MLVSEPADDDRTQGILVLGIITIVAPIVALILRFWSRAVGLGPVRRNSRFWWDDWAALCSLPFALTQSALTIWGTTIGWGKHMWDYTLEDLINTLKLFFALGLVYQVANSIARMSALLFYARVFTTHKKWFRIALRVSGAMIVVQTLLGLLLSVFQCSPTQAYWTIDTDTEGDCTRVGFSNIFILIFYVAIDIVILLLPIPILWRLSIRPLQKLLIACLFVSGYMFVLPPSACYKNELTRPIEILSCPSVV